MIATDTQQEEGCEVTFSTSVVFARHMLTCPSEDGVPRDPIIDMKIQTPLDQPVTVFDAERGLAEAPTGGGWYRFPLRLAEIHLLQDSTALTEL